MQTSGSPAAPQDSSAGQFLLSVTLEERYPVPDADPVVVSRFLLDQNGSSQRDIVSEFGSETTVSLVLARKRQLTRDHIARLSSRFHDSPSVFFPKM